MIFQYLVIAYFGYYVECIDHDISLGKTPFMAHSPAFLNQLPTVLPKPKDGRLRLPYLPDNSLNSWGNDILPNIVSVGINRYKISKFSGSGDEGKVFEGYDLSDPQRESVIIKIFHPRSKNMDFLISFLNEKRALWYQSRLIQADQKSQIIVSKKIQGKLLDKCINDLMINEEYEKVADLLYKYLDLLPWFRQTYHLVHGDAHPKNVIVDRDGNLHLIDFGFTVRLSNDSAVAKTQIENDESIMMYWANFYLKFMESRIHGIGWDNF
jgi:serine/threonine protein kinase